MIGPTYYYKLQNYYRMYPLLNTTFWVVPSNLTTQSDPTVCPMEAGLWVKRQRHLYHRAVVEVVGYMYSSIEK